MAIVCVHFYYVAAFLFFVMIFVFILRNFMQLFCCDSRLSNLSVSLLFCLVWVFQFLMIVSSVDMPVF